MKKVMTHKAVLGVYTAHRWFVVFSSSVLLLLFVVSSLTVLKDIKAVDIDVHKVLSILFE